MTYISGNLTSANPAADLYAVIDAALTTAGYTFVNTVVISAKTHKIWRSSAAGNSANLDWYLDVVYTTTGAGSIWLGLFEDYNASTDTGYRGLYNTTNTTVDQTYYSRYGATGYALETNWATTSNSLNVIDVSTSAFGYWISITTDRIIALTSVSGSKVITAGLYEPTNDYSTYVGASLFPLAAAQLIDDSGLGLTSSVMVTRIPKAPIVYSSWASVARLYSYNTFSTVLEGGFGTIGDNSINPYLGYTSPRGRNIYVVFSGTISGSTGFVVANSTGAAVVGKLKDVLVFSATAAVTRGDTITIAGDTWVVATKSSSYNLAYAFKAI